MQKIKVTAFNGQVNGGSNVFTTDDHNVFGLFKFLHTFGVANVSKSSHLKRLNEHFVTFILNWKRDWVKKFSKWFKMKYWIGIEFYLNAAQIIPYINMTIHISQDSNSRVQCVFLSFRLRYIENIDNYGTVFIDGALFDIFYFQIFWTLEYETENVNDFIQNSFTSIERLIFL